MKCNQLKYQFIHQVFNGNFDNKPVQKDEKNNNCARQYFVPSKVNYDESDEKAKSSAMTENIKKIHQQLDYLMNNQSELMERFDILDEDVLIIGDEIESMKVTLRLLLLHQQSMNAVLNLLFDQIMENNDKLAQSANISKQNT